jgi:RNA polymerase sigma factor (sigma-70 family)
MFTRLLHGKKEQSMMIKYEFVTGETLELEVSEGIGEFVLALDQEMKNNNRRETRRRETTRWEKDKQEGWVDLSVDVEEEVTAKEDRDMLYFALTQLKTQQRELIGKIFYQGFSETAVAKEKGVSQQAISKQLKVITKHLKKFLERGL